jgi:hypothetical protein
VDRRLPGPPHPDNPGVYRLPLFFEDFLPFFFVGIYIFTQSNSLNLP